MTRPQPLSAVSVSIARKTVRPEYWRGTYAARARSGPQRDLHVQRLFVRYAVDVEGRRAADDLRAGDFDLTPPHEKPLDSRPVVARGHPRERIVHSLEELPRAPDVRHASADEHERVHLSAGRRQSLGNLERGQRGTAEPANHDRTRRAARADDFQVALRHRFDRPRDGTEAAAVERQTVDGLIGSEVRGEELAE